VQSFQSLDSEALGLGFGIRIDKESWQAFAKYGDDNSTERWVDDESQTAQKCNSSVANYLNAKRV
jgi:hypothetical protein